MPQKGESSVATISYLLSVISYFLCMIQTRRLNNRSWVVPQTYGMTTFVCWYLLPAKKQKIPKNMYLPLIAKPICIFREVREFRCIVSSKLTQTQNCLLTFVSWNPDHHQVSKIHPPKSFFPLILTLLQKKDQG